MSPTPQPVKALRAVVQGRVQGVGFRIFVLREATSRSITGVVRNMGREDEVEVIACGDETAVDNLIVRLHVGPPGAHVTQVNTYIVDPVPPYRDFSIRY